MKINLLLKDGTKIYTNNRLPDGVVFSARGEELTSNPKLLEGKLNPRGEVVYITARSYQIRRKEYSLADGKLVCIFTSNNELVPVLRPSRGKERDAFKRVVKQNKHLPAIKQGESCLYWPMVH